MAIPQYNPEQGNELMSYNVPMTPYVPEKLYTPYVPESYIGDTPKIDTKVKEVYDPRLNAYISTDKRIPTGTSIVTRSPSVSESIKIREAQAKGDIFDRPTSEITKEAQREREAIIKFNELTKDLDKLEGEELEKRLSELEKIKNVKVVGMSTQEGEEKQIFFEPTKIGVGFGINKRQVDVSELDTRTKTGLYSTGLRYTLGKRTEEELLKAGVPKTGLFGDEVIPAREGEFKLWSGTGIYNPQTGNYDPQKFKVDIPETIRKDPTRPETIGKAVSYSPYLIPYVFEGEQALKLGELSTEKGKLNVWGGTKSFVKEYPSETFFLGGLGAFKVLRAGKRYVTEPLIFREKLVVDKRIPNVGSVTKPTTREVYYDTLLGKEVIKDTGSQFTLFGQTAREGSKVTITTRPQLFFQKLYRKIGVPEKYVKTGLGKPTYEGVYALDKQGYKEALELLTKRGYTESQTRGLIRLRRPALFQEKATGEIVVKATDDSLDVLLGGKRVVTTVQGEKGGVKFLQKKPRESIIASLSKPYKTEKGIEIMSFEEKTKNLFKPLGKQEETFKGFAGTKSIKEYEKGELFAQVDVSKKVIPLERDLKTSGAKVFVEKGEPSFIITDSSISEAKGFTGGGKQSSSQFLENLYKTQQAKATSVTSLIKTPKVPKIKDVLEVTSKSTTIPSIWAGTGLYERTSGASVFELGTQTQSSITGQVFYPIQDRQDVFTEVKLDTKLNTIPITKMDTRLDTRERTRFVQPIKLKEEVIPKLGLMERVIQSPKEKLVQISRQTQKQINILKTTKTTQPRTPRIRTPKIRFKLPQIGKTKEKGIKLAEDSFKVFVKKFGEDVEVGEFETLESAKGKLFNELKGTLRASGFVTKKGEKVKVNDWIGGEFRLAKKDPFRIVQKRERRLGTKQEVSEIKFFKGRR